MLEVLAMGDHGIYVWTVYAVGIVFLAGLGLYPILSLKHLTKRHQEDGVDE